MSPQFRHNGSTSILLASAEQNLHQLQQYRSSKHEIQQYYPLDGNSGTVLDSSNDSRLTSSGIRNGFRPSTIRHRKLRLATANAQRNSNLHENRESPPKSAIVESHASARLKSEIDHINGQLQKHKESSKSLHLPRSRVRRQIFISSNFDHSE